jgi:hypothetical protein
MMRSMRSRAVRSPKVMISARRKSFQLAMNRIRVAMNSRNSANVGDRNSSVGWTHSNFGIWNEESAFEPPSMPCNSCHSASGRSNTCSFSRSIAPSSGSRELHSISGEEIRPTMKKPWRYGAYEQHRTERAWNLVTFEKACRR